MDIILVYILPLYYKLDHDCTSVLLCPYWYIISSLLTVNLFMSLLRQQLVALIDQTVDEAR
jgi:hypothetical protein